MLGEDGQDLVKRDPAGRPGTVRVQHDQGVALAGIVEMHGHAADHYGPAGRFLGESGGHFWNPRFYLGGQPMI